MAELVSGIDDSSVPTVDAVDVVDASLSELDSFESEVTLSEVEDSVTVSPELVASFLGGVRLYRVVSLRC